MPQVSERAAKRRERERERARARARARERARESEREREIDKDIRIGPRNVGSHESIQHNTDTALVSVTSD